jgi:hypothetical protein
MAASYTDYFEGADVVLRQPGLEAPAEYGAHGNNSRVMETEWTPKSVSGSYIKSFPIWQNGASNLRCNNCGVKFTIALTTFEFHFSAVPWHPYLAIDAAVDATLTTDITLAATLSKMASLSGSHEIISIPIPPSISIPLGPLTISAGASLTLTAGYKMSADGTVGASVTASVASKLTAHAGLDTRSSPESSMGGSIEPFTWQQKPTFSANLQADGDAEVYLTPMLSLGITHLMAVTAQTDAVLRADLNYRSPPTPFPGIPSGRYDPEPSSPSWMHSGDCKDAHSVQYGVVVGLENSFANAAIHEDLASSISHWLSHFDYTHEFANLPLPTTDKGLISGCLLPVKAKKH